jgi:hypothetical protein
VDDAQQRADRELAPDAHPWVQLRPGPAIHADFSATATLACANNDSAARRIEVSLGEVACLTDPQTGSPQDDDERS